MISGTIIIEDQAITFTLNSNNNIVYTVSDTVSGLQETKKVSGKEFLISLGIALNWDGEIPGEDAYELAESVQPDNPELRFIP